jgi:hypothetical protein
MGDQQDHIVLYPAGGAFNRLRLEHPNNVFLENLLEENWARYSEAPSHSKKEYVRKNIFARIHATGRVLMIFKGDPVGGNLAEPKEDEAFERIAQRLRDMKKRKKTRKTVGGPSMTRKKARKATKPPSSDEEEENDEGKCIETR